MRFRIFGAAAALATAFAAYTPAVAHVVLETREAPAGSYYKAVFRVPHGCGGSPTTAIAVTLPDGIMSAKPQPKPGWTLAVERQALPRPVAGPHGSTVSERVTRIAWSGGDLPDAWFDAFAIQVRLPDAAPGTVLRFPVEQTCAAGSRHWVGMGETQGDPAPALRLTAGHAHH